MVKEQTVSLTAIGEMVKVLKKELQNNPTLANELLAFLKDRNIDIPTLNSEQTNRKAPIRYGGKHSDEKINKLKSSFEGIHSIENIL